VILVFNSLVKFAIMKVERFSVLLLLYIVFYFAASTSPLSKYKDIAQAPGAGVHSVRVRGLGLAFVDLSATVLLAGLIAYRSGENMASVFVALVFLSVPVHMLFGVDTALMKMFHMRHM
jgi:hypothetical protein